MYDLDTTTWAQPDSGLKIATEICSYLVATGCCTLISGWTMQIGNSDHLLKVFPTPGVSTGVTIQILAIDGTTPLVNMSMSFINSGTLTTKMVYSGNGFGASFIAATRLEIAAIKLMDANNNESWGIMATIGTSSARFYANGTDTYSVLTGANLVNTDAGTFDASVSFLYTDDTLKNYTGRTMALAGSDGLGALANGGVSAPSVMRLSGFKYLWKGANAAVYVTDISW